MLSSSFSSRTSSSPLFHGAAFHRRQLRNASSFAMARNLDLPSNPRHAVRSNKPLSPEKLELIRSPEMMSWGEENLLTMLKPVEDSWQPHDFLPDPTSEEFFHDVKELQARAAEIPDDYLVCLVGNMITEEALPTYQTVANTVEGWRDETGASPTAWARWTRAWTAEENRHGDLLNKYLYLTGRCNMRQIEKTVQYLIGAGMDNGVDSSPYNGAIYTSFQERATFISHGNTARQAKLHGDATLAKICGVVAADERRHEMAYSKVVDKLFDLEPDTTMKALAEMMRKRITMPALLMTDGQDPSLFNHFAAVAQRVGVYTAGDYIDMVEFFVEKWKVGDRANGLSGEGRAAQEYVCRLAERFRKMEERAEEMRKKKARWTPEETVQFGWIFNKSVLV